MKKLSDAELVARCQSGSEPAWAELVHRNQAVVFAICRAARLDDGAAEDVFLDCFARLLERLPDMERPDRVRSWLITTARRRAIDRLRVTHREHPLDDAALARTADPKPSVEDRLMAVQRRDLVHRALASLAERCRELLSLLYLGELRLPYEEVAAQLGLAVGSIGPMRARCLEKLRGEFERMGDDANPWLPS